MAKKAKKKNKTKGTVLTIILTALITTIGMYVYNTYTKIDVNPQNYETQKPVRKQIESMFQKKLRLGIHGGVWCTVDTENKFWFGNEHYLIDEKATQYQPVDTEYGEYYSMDKILASGGKFYDMNYDEVKVYRIGGIVSYADIEKNFGFDLS